MRKRYQTIDEAEEKLGMSVDFYQEHASIMEQDIFDGNSSGVKRSEEVYTPRMLDECESDTEVIENALKNMATATLKTVVSNALKSFTSKEVIQILLDVLNLSVPDDSKSSFVTMALEKMSTKVQHQIVDDLFLEIARKSGIDTNPKNFATLALAAMSTLKANKKPNLVYKWCECLVRKESQKPVLEMSKMPFGLIQYQIEFFSCTNTSQIRESHDYKTWLDTMHAEFGGRFLKLFRGPMWSNMDRESIKDPTKVTMIFFTVFVRCSSIHSISYTYHHMQTFWNIKLKVLTHKWTIDLINRWHNLQ